MLMCICNVLSVKLYTPGMVVMHPDHFWNPCLAYSVMYNSQHECFILVQSSIVCGPHYNIVQLNHTKLSINVTNTKREAKSIIGDCKPCTVRFFKIWSCIQLKINPSLFFKKIILLKNNVLKIFGSSSFHVSLSPPMLMMKIFDK